MGEAVLEKLDNFAVCTVSSDPGAGKSRDVPPSLLGTLMERDRQVLSYIKKLHVDLTSTTRFIDETSWECVLKKKPRSRSSLSLHPPSAHLGEAVLEKLDNFAACTVSGDPGADQSRDVPPSLLSTLMERDRYGQYGIALCSRNIRAQLRA